MSDTKEEKIPQLTEEQYAAGKARAEELEKGREEGQKRYQQWADKQKEEQDRRAVQGISR